MKWKDLTMYREFLKVTFEAMDKIISRLNDADRHHLDQNQIRDHVKLYDSCMNTLHEYLRCITNPYIRSERFPSLTGIDAMREARELIDLMHVYPVSFHLGPDAHAYKIQWMKVINTSEKIDAIEKEIEAATNAILNWKAGDSDTDLSYNQFLVDALRIKLSIAKSIGWNCNPNADCIRYVREIQCYKELANSYLEG